jgi:hypothetical protein
MLSHIRKLVVISVLAAVLFFATFIVFVPCLTITQVFRQCSLNETSSFSCPSKTIVTMHDSISIVLLGYGFVSGCGASYRFTDWKSVASCGPDLTSTIP